MSCRTLLIALSLLGANGLRGQAAPQKNALAQIERDGRFHFVAFEIE